MRIHWRHSILRGHRSFFLGQRVVDGAQHRTPHITDPLPRANLQRPLVHIQQHEMGHLGRIIEHRAPGLLPTAPQGNPIKGRRGQDLHVADDFRKGEEH